MQMFLRRWHRWIAFPAAIFLLLVAVTGIWLAANEFFDEEEALRERTRTLISPVTTLTADAEFAAPLARARAAVAAQSAGAPLDSVVWQFKGDAPTITFYLGRPTGGEDRKVIVDARTGTVLRTGEYTDKPFLMRVHSGEWMGDGGLVMAMLWGASLVLLTVSGFIIYIKMRRPRLSGLRRVFWLLLIGGLAVNPPEARADSPFYTDDPLFSPGWEIKAGLTGEHNAGGSQLSEVLDWNYAVVPNVRLNLTTYTKHVRPIGGRHEFGYGDTEFKMKWRFLEENPSAARPALGIAPKVYIPTANQNRGLGDGVWRFQLPIQLGKTMGRWYHFAEAGYQWAFDRTATDVVYGGAGTLYSFTSHFGAGVELYQFAPTQAYGNWQLLTTLGAVYTFNEHWAIKTSLSRTLRNPNRGGSNPSGVFYVVWNF